MTKYKLVLFDMDGTLLKDRGIFVIAQKLGFLDELTKLIRDENLEYYERSIEIAKRLKGQKISQFLDIFRTIPFQDNLENLISNIKKRGIVTAIATDSYQFLADDVKNRLGIDYAFANNLISNEDVITGDLKIHNKDLASDFASGQIYSICKSCVLEKLCKQLDINVDESIAVGDGIVDIGMIKRSGLGIAINASETVNKHADIKTDNLNIILDHI